MTQIPFNNSLITVWTIWADLYSISFVSVNFNHVTIERWLQMTTHIYPRPRWQQVDDDTFANCHHRILYWHLHVSNVLVTFLHTDVTYREEMSPKMQDAC